MNTKKFLNISDFAKIAGVSRQTLIYYDRIGLFSPAFTASNKYRAYSHNQVNSIGIITILRDLGVPLKKIKEISTNISADTMEKTLRYQLNEIEEKIERLSVLKDMTQIRLEQISEGKTAANSAEKFSVIELAEDIPVYLGDEIGKKAEDIDDETIIDFFDKIEKRGLPAVFTFGYIKNAEEIWQNSNGCVSRMWFRLKNKKHANAFIEKGRYLVGYAKGDYGKTDYIYDELAAYAKKNHLVAEGNVYEEYLIDEFSEKNPDEFLIKILVRVR